MFTVTRVRVAPTYFLVFGLGVAANALIALAARIVLERDLRKTRKDGPRA